MQMTCFTSTTVHILTQKTLHAAQEFSHYANVAASGQHAYEADSAAAAAGSRWDNHKQYIADEMRGDRKAQQLAAR
jgi:hypothetical protein